MGLHAQCHGIPSLIYPVDPSLEYVQRFATKEAADSAANKDEDDEDEEMSDIGSISEDEDHTMDD